MGLRTRRRKRRKRRKMRRQARIRRTRTRSRRNIIRAHRGYGKTERLSGGDAQTLWLSLLLFLSPLPPSLPLSPSLFFFPPLLTRSLVPSLPHSPAPLHIHDDDGSVMMLMARRNPVRGGV